MAKESKVRTDNSALRATQVMVALWEGLRLITMRRWETPRRPALHPDFHKWRADQSPCVGKREHSENG